MCVCICVVYSCNSVCMCDVCMYMIWACAEYINLYDVGTVWCIHVYGVCMCDVCIVYYICMYMYLYYMEIYVCGMCVHMMQACMWYVHMYAYKYKRRIISSSRPLVGSQMPG